MQQVSASIRRHGRALAGAEPARSEPIAFVVMVAVLVDRAAATSIRCS